MSEFIDSFFKALRERVGNPFVGSFALSWLLWNWKFMVLLVSDDVHANHKISLLTKEHTGWWVNLVAPLSTAIFFILIMPYIYWGIEWLQKHAKIGRYKNRKKFLEARSEELSESAASVEKEITARERLSKAEEVLDQKLKGLKTNTQKNLYVSSGENEGPFEIDTGRNGASINFEKPTKNISFTAVSHSDRLSESNRVLFKILNGNIAGEHIDSFSIGSSGVLHHMNVKLDKPTKKITIVNSRGFAEHIDIFNLNVES